MCHFSVHIGNTMAGRTEAKFWSLSAAVSQIAADATTQVSPMGKQRARSFQLTLWYHVYYSYLAPFSSRFGRRLRFNSLAWTWLVPTWSLQERNSIKWAETQGSLSSSSVSKSWVGTWCSARLTFTLSWIARPSDVEAKFTSEADFNRVCLQVLRDLLTEISAMSVVTNSMIIIAKLRL